MLIILPLLTSLLVFIDLLGLHSRRQGQDTRVRAVILESAAFIGGCLVLFSEGLGLFRLLAAPGAAICWGVALVAAGVIGWRKGWIAAAVIFLRTRRLQPDRFDIIAGVALVGILGLLFFIAVISPSNNNDSLLYHMSRVVHWAQEGSLAHYPTGYEHQLYNPIFAELSILNARLLWGDDRLANLIQWACLVIGILGASVLARLLGARRRGQWMAALFTLSLPIALLQATSTQNDLVTAAWLIVLLYFILLVRQRALFVDETAALGLSMGLGLLTKGTFYAFAILPGAYFAFLSFRKMQARKALIVLAAVAGIVILVNLGFWYRNWETFGTPLGSTGFVSAHADVRPRLGTYLGNVARNVVENFATPSDAMNAKIVGVMKAAFKPIDPVMDSFAVIWAWNQEDYAGAPLHMLLVPFTLVLLLLFRRKLKADILPYTLLVLGLFISLSVVVNYILSASRFQIAFFIAWGPIFGIAVESLGRKWITTACVVLLLILTIPWVVFNRSRPLIAMRPSRDPFTLPCLAGCTSGSILNEPPARVLFAERPDLQEPYSLATGAIRQAACRSVGLELDSHDYEYTFWWLLDAPQSGIRLETVYTYPELERYLDPAFKPCAILCTICRGKTHLHGLPLVSDYTGLVQLYMGPGYTPDPER